MSFGWILLALLALTVLANLILGRLPRPPRDSGGVVETAHGPVHYLETVGEGMPLIFIHGMPGSSRDFDLVRDALAGRHTIAVDRPGYAWSKGPPQDFGPQLDAIVETARSLGVERAVIVGHSFGGMAAMGMAIRHPEFVERLLLVASAGGGSRVTESMMRQARWIQRIELPVIRQICDLLFFRIGRRLVVHIGAEAIYGNSSELALQRRVAASMLARHNSVRALIGDRLAFNHNERLVTRGLARIEVPVVILHGDQDPTVPIRNARRLAEALPNCELIEVKGAHHLPARNAADVVAAIERLDAR
jgi:pimeloyl-ACP methyl ester carboxylesterase